MKLHIKLFSLKKFLDLYGDNSFIRSVLVHKDANIYYIKAMDKELEKLTSLLDTKGIKYNIKK